jgi:hypothetical protein
VLVTCFIAQLLIASPSLKNCIFDFFYVCIFFSAFTYVWMYNNIYELKNLILCIYLESIIKACRCG